MWLSIFFAILPSALMGGVALQALVVYMAGLLPAFFLYKNGNLQKSSSNFFGVLSLILFIGYVCFPLANIVSYFRVPPAYLGVEIWPLQISLKKICDSQFTFSLFVTAIILMIIAIISKRKKDSLAWRLSSEQFIASFISGIFAASVLWVGFLGVQSVTGFDFRVSGLNIFDASKTGSLYRVYGFYGHPLSVAGVALAWLAFVWTLFWFSFDKRFKDFNAILAKKRFLRCFLILSSMLYFIAVILSGGRTALAVALIVLVLVPFFVEVNKQFHYIKAAVAVGVLGFGGSAIYFSGVKLRIIELINRLQANELIDDRILFWKTHFVIFQSNWIFGRGHAWLENGLRKTYYLSLGYKDLAENKNFNAHNLYIEILADVGIIGSLILIFAASMFFVIMKKHMQSPLAKIFGIAFLVSVVANLLHGLTENTFFVSNIMLWYLTMLWIIIWITEISLQKSVKNDGKN